MYSDEKVTQNISLVVPALSAIVVVPDSYQTVRHTISHLKMQTAVKQIEVILVVPSRKKIQMDESDLSCFHSWSDAALLCNFIQINGLRTLQESFAGGRLANCSVLRQEDTRILVLG